MYISRTAFIRLLYDFLCMPKHSHASCSVFLRTARCPVRALFRPQYHLPFMLTLFLWPQEPQRTGRDLTRSPYGLPYVLMHRHMSSCAPHREVHYIHWLSLNCDTVLCECWTHAWCAEECSASDLETLNNLQYGFLRVLTHTHMLSYAQRSAVNSTS